MLKIELEATVAMIIVAASLGCEGDGNRAAGKFCNNLRMVDGPTTLKLDVGEGSGAAVLFASSGECSSAIGTSCAAIPAGENVLIQLWNGNDLLVSGRTPHVKDGEEWAFVSRLNSDGKPTLDIGTFKMAGQCAQKTPGEFVERSAQERNDIDVLNQLVGDDGPDGRVLKRE